MEDSTLKELAYYDGDTPNMVAIKQAYHSDFNENEGYYERTEDAYKVRRNLWAGKSKSLKKEHPSAKPWQYASDNEAWVVDPRIDSLVALAWNAWQNGDVFAAPVGSDDLERSASVTNFMRWTMSEWVPSAQREFELCANYMLEKAIAATYIGYEKHNTPIKERVDLEQLAEAVPEFAELFADETREDEALALLEENFEYVNTKRAKKALKQLRREGVAEIPVSIKGVDRPIISTKAADAEVFFPPDTIDADHARRCHVVHFMGPQELQAFGQNEGWDEELIEDIIQNHMGITQRDIDGQHSTNGFLSRGVATTMHTASPDTTELTPIVRTFLRQTDTEDGAMGIYEVVWSPRTSQDEEDPKYLSYELMDGFDTFPVVVTPLRYDAKRLYESRSLCDNLRGLQRNVKVLTDGMIDNISINMDPPRFHPPNGAPQKWGASTSSAIRRGTANDYGNFEVNDMSRSSTALEEFFDKQADRISGLDMDDPISVQRQQMFVSRILHHWEKVAKMVWKVYKEFGPDEIAFRVTGDPSIAPQMFEKGDAGEDIDIRIIYDVQLNNPEYREKVSQALISTMQADVEGAGNRREALNVLYRLNVPQFAPRILQSEEQSQDEVTQRVSEDLTKIQARIPVNAIPNGASVALQFLQQYESQEDVQAQLQQDMGFAQRYAAYKEQYMMQMEQQRNAQIGRNVNPDAMVNSQNV
jgi:hypothetical protein